MTSAAESILLVDDEVLVLDGLRRGLRPEFTVDVAAGAQAGLAALAGSHPFAVVVSDMYMPGMDGVAFLAETARLQPDAIRIMLTGSDAIATAMAAINQAEVFRFLRKPCPLDELAATLRVALEQWRVAGAERALRASLSSDLVRSHADTAAACDATVAGWVCALDLRDHATAGHSERVTRLATALARTFGFAGQALEDLRRGALLHDIGKMGVPDRILLKDGALDGEEWATMRQHPVYARRMLSSVAFLEHALDIPCFHHERWDGSGYPHGLAGTAIPLPARIFAVVDVWDALTSDRPYRAALTAEAASRYLCAEAGRQFDPDVVEAFLAIVDVADVVATG